MARQYYISFQPLLNPCCNDLLPCRCRRLGVGTSSRRRGEHQSTTRALFDTPYRSAGKQPSISDNATAIAAASFWPCCPNKCNSWHSPCPCRVKPLISPVDGPTSIIFYFQPHPNHKCSKYDGRWSTCSKAIGDTPILFLAGISATVGRGGSPATKESTKGANTAWWGIIFIY